MGEVVEGIALLRADPNPFRSLYTSHWASALNLAGKASRPVLRASYITSRLTQVDSVQVMNLGYVRFLLP